MLRSTLEEEKLLESIPSDIKELIEDTAKEEIQDEIGKLDDKITALEEERDNLADACMKFTIEKFIAGLGKVKRKKFTITAAEIAGLTPSLDSRFIGFKKTERFDDYRSMDDLHYIITESKDGVFDFVLNE